MRKSLLFCLALVASASLFLTGCSDNSTPQRPTVSPANPPPGNGGNPPAVQPPKAPESIFPPNARADLTTNYYFVIDGSGSMNDRPPRSAWKDKSKMEYAIMAAVETANQLPDNVNLGLFVFDRYGAREVVPLGSKNKDKFLAAVRAIRADGGTPLGDSIYKGTAALRAQYLKQLGYGEYRLVIITDGEASDTNVMDNAVREAARSEPEKGIVPIPIYTIGFGIDGQHALMKSSVSYRAANNISEIRQALKEFTSELDVP